MSDTQPETGDVKFPADQVLDTLLNKHAENKERIAGINGELGDRLRNQYDLNSDFTPWAWGLISKVAYVFRSNELKAREMLRIARAALDWVEKWMDRNGHAGDIATMAQKAAPQGDNTPKGSQPKAEAPAEPQQDAAPASNVVPLEGKAGKPAKAPKAPKQAKGEKKPKDSVDEFRESLRGTVEQGDAHIKQVAAGQIPTPPSELPDIPESLDRRKKNEGRERTSDPDQQDVGKYRILS
jgi:hypothetical protein